MAQLDGIRAIVTGATTGLGRAMAEALAGAGASVVVTSRSAERARAAAAEIGGDAIGVAMDVRSEEAVALGSTRRGRGSAASICW
jgi:NAD(P)-dependent dehydrogenase (short-subunit alcohol dehydrogenase family)